MLLPNDWREASFADVTQRAMTWQPERMPRDRIRYVDVSAVSREALRIVSDAQHTPADAPSRARKIVHAGDTILATVRPSLRRIAQVPPELHNEIASTAFCVLRPNTKLVSPDFLFYAAQRDEVFDGLSAQESGASYPAVRDADVLAQLLPLPPLAEQSAIASVLNEVRSAVLLEMTAIDATSELKRAAMRELFTRGLRGEAQKETEIGPIPESWEVVAIGDVARQTQYGLSVRGQQEGQYPILRMNCQDDGRVVMRNLQYVDLDPAVFETFRLRRGDLLFNRTNSIELVGRTALYEVDGDAVFASYLVRLTVDEQECVPAYLNYFMNWDRTQIDIKRLASRAVGQANINATKLRTVLSPKPAMDEQREIVAILEAIDRKIALHKEKRAVLEALFKSLLHKLMAGAVRVADLNLDALGGAAEAA